MSLGRYSKTIAAIVAYVLAWAAQVIASAPHAITSAEWLALAGGIAVAAGVYGATNTPPASSTPQTFNTTAQYDFQPAYTPPPAPPNSTPTP